MELLLFKTFKKRTDSTKLVDITKPDKTCDVYLKRDTVYSSPVFTIESEEYPVYTYAYLVPLQSYYFVTSRKQQNVGYWEITLKLDPLATFRTEIANYNCFVERCADSRYYNVNIADAALSSEDLITIGAQTSTQIFEAGTSYIVRLVGQDTTGIATYVFTSTRAIGLLFNPILSQIASGSGEDVGLSDLITALVCDPSKYLVGAYMSPIAAGAYQGVENDRVYIGFWDSLQTATRVTARFTTQTLSIPVPQGIYSDFRKTDANFSRYALTLPGIGTIEVSPDIMDSAISIKYCFEYQTGGISYNLLADGVSIATYSGNIYAPYSVGSSDTGNGQQLLLAGAQVAAGIISGGASEMAMAGAAISGAQSMVQNTPSVSAGGSAAAVHAMGTNIVLSVTQKRSAEFPVEQFGRPCCKNLTIGNLQGFVKCGMPSIELAAESDIIDEVNNYLANGFYFE